MAALICDNFRLEGRGLDGIGKLEFLSAMKAQLEAFPDYSENPPTWRKMATWCASSPTLLYHVEALPGAAFAGH
jgi:hypothetical protein